jgi:hypothetical protein
MAGKTVVKVPALWGCGVSGGYRAVVMGVRGSKYRAGNRRG